MPVWVFSSVEWEGGWHSIVPSVAAEVADGRKTGAIVCERRADAVYSSPASGSVN